MPQVSPAVLVRRVDARDVRAAIDAIGTADRVRREIEAWLLRETARPRSRKRDRARRRNHATRRTAAASFVSFRGYTRGNPLLVPEAPAPWPLGLVPSPKGHGAPGRNRTCDLWLRKPTLYPTELRAPREGRILPHKGAHHRATQRLRHARYACLRRTQRPDFPTVTRAPQESTAPGPRDVDRPPSRGVSFPACPPRGSFPADQKRNHRLPLAGPRPAFLASA